MLKACNTIANAIKVTVLRGDNHQICLRASHFFKRFRIWLLSNSRICPSCSKPHYFVLYSSFFSRKNAVQDKKAPIFLTDSVLKRQNRSSSVRFSSTLKSDLCFKNVFRLQLYTQPLKALRLTHSG